MVPFVDSKSMMNGLRKMADLSKQHAATLEHLLDNILDIPELVFLVHLSVYMRVSSVHDTLERRRAHTLNDSMLL